MKLISTNIHHRYIYSRDMLCNNSFFIHHPQCCEFALFLPISDISDTEQYRLPLQPCPSTIVAPAALFAPSLDVVCETGFRLLSLRWFDKASLFLWDCPARDAEPPWLPIDYERTDAEPSLLLLILSFPGKNIPLRSSYLLPSLVSSGMIVRWC